jgi:hypothetical protein
VIKEYLVFGFTIDGNDKKTWHALEVDLRRGDLREVKMKKMN